MKLKRGHANFAMQSSQCYKENPLASVGSFTGESAVEMAESSTRLSKYFQEDIKALVEDFALFSSAISKAEVWNADLQNEACWNPQDPEYFTCQGEIVGQTHVSRAQNPSDSTIRWIVDSGRASGSASLHGSENEGGHGDSP